MLKCINEEYKTIEMIEGDYGLVLPIQLEVEGEETITAEDTFVIKICQKVNETPLVEKSYSDIQNNTIEFSLTENESEKLSVGNYLYDLDWYNGQVFLGNLIAKSKFMVKEKAGVVNES